MKYKYNHFFASFQAGRESQTSIFEKNNLAHSFMHADHKSWKISHYMIFLIMSIQASISSAATYTVEAGNFQALGVSDSWSTNIPFRSVTKYESMGSSIVGFSKTGNVTGSTLCSNHSNWLKGEIISKDLHAVESIDGYEGIRVADGVILVPMNLNVSAIGAFANVSADDMKQFNSSVTSNDKGRRNNIGSKSNPYLWCSSLQDIDDPYRWVRIDGGDASSSGSVYWGVYASPSAAAGTYAIPELFMGQSIINALTLFQFTQSTLQSSSIVVRRPLECRITSPTSIDFGPVNIKGIRAHELLASRYKDVVINCTSDTADAVADMTISFTGNYSNRNWGRLDITNNINQNMGYIRGRYIQTNGSCVADKENEVGFDGESGIKIIKAVKNGIIKLPITWSLCSNDSGLLGRGDAQATINVNWD